MYRVVYCPSETLLDQAVEMAEPLGLQILLGPNAYLQNVDFDKTKLQVVQVPDTHTLEVRQEIVPLGGVQVVLYNNDFETLGDGTSLQVTPDGHPTYVVQPEVVEAHFARFVFRPDVAGYHTIAITTPSGLTFSEQFKVTE